MSDNNTPEFKFTELTPGNGVPAANFSPYAFNTELPSTSALANIGWALLGLIGTALLIFALPLILGFLIMYCIFWVGIHVQNEIRDVIKILTEDKDNG